MNSSPSCCSLHDRFFDNKIASKDLKRYKKNGPGKSTRKLLDILDELIKESANDYTSLLDIGGGIGSIPLALSSRGFSNFTSVEASSAYQQIQKKEFENQNLDVKADFILGDFTDVSDQVNHADVVTLDKVICCYDDYRLLVTTSVSKSNHILAIVIPRNVWWVKAVVNVSVFIRRIFGSRFKIFVHPIEEIERIILDHGFKNLHDSFQREWHLLVYEVNK